MIVAAAICPCPPLLAAELAGQADVLPELRAACATAVARLLAAGPDLVAVVGPAETTGTWDPAGQLNLAAYAPALGAAALRAAGPSAAGPSAAAPGAAALRVAAPGTSARRAAVPRAAGPPLPLALGIGARLLDNAAYAGPRSLRGIAAAEPAAGCLALGREIAASAPRVALLAVGDGTARRSVAAPGYLDERAAPFDEAVECAVRDGNLAALASLNQALAADLLAIGRPAWQALAGALLTAPFSVGFPSGDPLSANAPSVNPLNSDPLSAAQPSAGRLNVGPPMADPLSTEILYAEAPLGVAYLVATLFPRISR
jgi:hypothetical protein